MAYRAIRMGKGMKDHRQPDMGFTPLTGVQVRHLLLLALPIVGEAGLDILHLALHPVHPEHTLLALELEGQDHQLHHQSEEDQSQTVGPGETVKQAGSATQTARRYNSRFVQTWGRYLRFIMGWEKRGCCVRGQDHTRPCGKDGIASDGAGPEGRPWRRRISPPPPRHTRAGGDIAAPGRKKRGDGGLVEPEQIQKRPLHAVSSGTRPACRSRRRYVSSSC